MLSVGLRLARSISACSSLGAIAPTTLAVTWSCKSKMSSSAPSKRSAHRCAPVEPSMSCPAIRTRLAALRTLLHVTDTQFARHLLHVHGAALVGETRVPRDHEEPAQARQRRCNVLHHTIGEVL